MKLLYLANVRLPTEKAHGLQIMQNCEAFAAAGADVTLWVARRLNTPELRGIRDVWAHYGVERNFALRRLPCLDLLPLVAGRSGRLARVLFQLEVWTFALMVFLRAFFASADVFYSRDEVILLVLSIIKPRQKLAYEAHTLAQGRWARALQRRVVRRVGQVFATTHKLADDLIELGAAADRMHVAHDGIRQARFEQLPEKAAARRELGVSQAIFIVGYVGRLHTLKMDKGVGALVEALAQVGDCALMLVGGPDEMAEEFRARWLDLGMEAARFLYMGQVAPEQVPLYLSAFDVCAMPFPWTTHFAYYASPIKLFEYMASQRPLVASNLPSVAEVVTDGESALLTAPADVAELAAAIRRLRDDAALRDRLAANAYRIVMDQYTWAARARGILAALGLSEAETKH